MKIEQWGKCPKCNHQNVLGVSGREVNAIVFSEGYIIEGWYCDGCGESFQRKYEVLATQVVLEVYYDASGEHITLDNRTEKDKPRIRDISEFSHD